MKPTEPVFCECKAGDGRSVPAVQNTAWTDENPGRGFICCRNYRKPEGCSFWKWADQIIDVKQNQKELMMLLRDEIWKLRNNNVDLKAHVDGLNAEIGRLKCLLHEKVKAEASTDAAAQEAEVTGLKMSLQEAWANAAAHDAEVNRLKMLLAAQEAEVNRLKMLLHEKNKGGGLKFFKPKVQKAIVLVVVLVLLAVLVALKEPKVRDRQSYMLV